MEQNRPGFQRIQRQRTENLQEIITFGKTFSVVYLRKENCFKKTILLSLIREQPHLGRPTLNLKVVILK